jgi:hypothetical protein
MDKPIESLSTAAIRALSMKSLPSGLRSVSSRFGGQQTPDAPRIYDVFAKPWNSLSISSES